MSSADTEWDEMKEILADFLVEANELVGVLDTDLVKLEGAPEDPDLLNEIFRAAHTIKGTSGFLALDDISSLTHKMEDVLNKLRKGELKVNGDINDVLLRSVDELKILLEDVAEGRQMVRDLSEIEARLTAIAEGTALEQPEITAPPAGETALSSKKTATVGPEKKTADQTIRVAVDRLDSLVNLMGELVLGRNSMVQTVAAISREHEDLDRLEELNQAGARINFITTEIQLAVMKMRMLPVSKVFGRFPRMVRDLAREAKKKIELDIYGDDTELDKSVIEEIGDPLVHLIRNACDHGIELPEVRTAAGKPETGTIRLGASQEGSNIVITIEDDGRGLDLEAIRARAVERGLVSPKDLERLADRDIFRFIFQPGFSTATVVTDVSGRGVGMDVVKTNIEKLKGMIDIESDRGRGTRIVIKLPLTLAIVQGLLVVSEGETYVIPLASVLETVRVFKEEIESVNRCRVITMRDGVLPVVHLNGVLKNGAGDADTADRPYVVVVGLAERRLGLVVDRLLGQEEVVIKSMGSYLGHTRGIAGATILGDGRVRLIVDLPGLFELVRR